MNFDILYKRTKTGSIQYWSIETWEGEHGACIEKRSGQLGTEKPLLHKEPILEGKQKRTPQQQAEFQAQSDWKKKLDSGYKTLSYLEDLAKQRGIL